ncbi:MAG: hypothetical protein NTZ78_04430 [Candidatus Aureabacteria bacterium]|nr:hypothetical protein [Candidatus Auribacterota bacterium]
MNYYVDPLHGGRYCCFIAHIAVDYSDIIFNVRVIEFHDIKRGYTLTYYQKMPDKVDPQRTNPACDKI